MHNLKRHVTLAVTLTKSERSARAIISLHSKVACLTAFCGTRCPLTNMSLLSIQLLAFSLLNYAYLVRSAPTPLTLPVTNISSPDTYQCNSSPEWATPRFYPPDCSRAADEFFVDELLQWGETRFEFTGRRTHSPSRLPQQLMPRKYTHSKLIAVEVKTI